jgi:hypothetical protein
MCYDISISTWRNPNESYRQHRDCCHPGADCRVVLVGHRLRQFGLLQAANDDDAPALHRFHARAPIRPVPQAARTSRALGEAHRRAAVIQLPTTEARLAHMRRRAF